MPSGGGRRSLFVGPAGIRSVAVFGVGLLLLSASLLAGCVNGGGELSEGADGENEDPVDGDSDSSNATDEGSQTGGSAASDADSDDGDAGDEGDGGPGPGSDGNTTQDEDDEGDGDGSGGAGDGGGSGGDDGGDGGGDGSSGEDEQDEDVSSDPWAGDDPPWPELSDAKVRPGVRIGVGATQCTSNFLFRSLVNGTLFLGTAAHCVDGVSLGTAVNVYDVDGDQVFRGSLAYSSWRAIGFRPFDDLTGDDVHPHDFALIKIPRDQREVVHPALIHYGGPTGVAVWEDVAFADWVLAYGNSGTRPVDQLDPQQGYVLDTHSTSVQGSIGHSVLTHMAAPPMPGDSGSPLLSEDSKALGILSAVTAGIPYGAWWEYASLPHALDFVNEYEDWDLRLATWDALDTLPAP